MFLVQGKSHGRKQIRASTSATPRKRGRPPKNPAKLKSPVSAPVTSHKAKKPEVVDENSQETRRSARKKVSLSLLKVVQHNFVRVLGF